MQFRRIIYTLTFLLAFCLLTSAQKLHPIDSDTLSTKLNSKIALRDSVVNYGMMFLNTPYRYGSNGVSSFDCSGYTSFVFRNFGYQLPRSSRDMAAKLPTIKTNELKPGDLVFFEGRRRNGVVGHVGIVVDARENGEFNFIHASVNNGVIITNSNEPYYKSRFVKAGRVFENEKYLVPNVELANNIESRVEKPVVSNMPETKIIPAQYHRVKRGETLSSISKRYDVSIAELKAQNGLKSTALKINQRLKLKDEVVVVVADEKPELLAQSNVQTKAHVTVEHKEQPATHTVKNGETLYAISKIYNISVNELKTINKLSESSIRTGQVLKLNVAGLDLAKAEVEKKADVSTSIESASVVDKKKNSPKEESKVVREETASIPQMITHKVTKGETLYSIARTYGCTIHSLKEWNNLPNSNLRIGEKLIVYPQTI